MITRSNSKKIRENLNRLPREVEATLPSWVKCTDPIPGEILEEVRSTVLVWIANVRNYCTKLYEESRTLDLLKNPPPTPGLNSSLKKHTSNPKIQLKMQKRGS